MTTRDEVFTSFNVCRDTNQPFQPGDGTKPFLLNTAQIRIDNQWINRLRLDLPEQHSRLMSHFNNFQQFTIKHVDVRWVPRWRDNSVSVNGSGTSNSGIEALAATHGFITMVQDLDDSQSRSTLEEYFQVRDQPNAKTWPLMSFGHFGHNPFVLDVIAQNSLSALEPQIPTPAPINTTAPVKFKWFSTKAGGAGQTIAFNDAIGTLGCKAYIYAPFNTSINTAQIVCGMWQWNVQFAFRFPDYRPPVAIPAYVVTGNSMSMIENNVLSNLQGEASKMAPMDQSPQFLSELGAAYAEKRKIDGTDPESEVAKETLKRLKQAAAEA